MSIAASHGAVAGRGGGMKEFDRHLAVPDRAVDGAVRGLQPFGVELLDLLVGLVHRAHAAGFLLRLAAHPQGRLGEALLLAFRPAQRS